MPREIRLLGYGVGSKMTRQQQLGPEGPLFDEDGTPVMVDILELVFLDHRTGDAVILPLTPEGVEAVKKAIGPQSNLVIPTPGMMPPPRI